MLTLQVLTALHIIAACVLVGSSVLLMRVTKRAESIPPRESARLSELLGPDLATVNSLALVVLGATGLFRMMEQETLGRLVEWSFISSAYGVALLVMIVLWLLIVVSAGLTVFYFRPRLAVQLPYDSSRQVADGRGGPGLVVTKKEEPQRGRGQEAVRQLLALEGDTVPHFLAVRLAIERKAAGLAAKRLTADDAEQLGRIVHLMGKEGLSDDEYVKLDAELHATIVRTAGDSALSKRYLSTQHLFREYSLHVLQLPERRQVAQAGHVEVVDAILSRDSGAARRAISKHLEAVRGEVKGYVKLVDHLDDVQFGQLGSDAWVKRLTVFNLVVGVLTLVDAGFLSYGGFK